MDGSGGVGLGSGQHSAGSISEWSTWSEHQWASNAAPKGPWPASPWGDISGPVRTLVSLSEQKGGGFIGGTSRTGVSPTLPALELLPKPELGRWETHVAVEHRQVVSAEWSPAAARFAFGRWG